MESKETKSDISEDLNIIHEYFSNLRCVNLNALDILSLTEIGNILNNYKLNHFEFRGTEFENGYSIESEFGSIHLYDWCNNHHCIKFKNLKIRSEGQNYTTQGDYVIFDFKHADVKLDVEDVTESLQEYGPF